MNLSRTAERLLEYALAFPEVREDHPWGERVAKVGAKVFLFFGQGSARGESLTLAMKLPQSGLAALDRPECEATAYGLGKHGWVTARYERGDEPPIELLQAWIEESYRAIAPKKLVRALDARSDAVARVVKPVSARKKKTPTVPVPRKPAAKPRPRRTS